jgi:hypothetical protein
MRKNPRKIFKFIIQINMVWFTKKIEGTKKEKNLSPYRHHSFDLIKCL